MTVKPANIIEPSLQLAKAIRGVLSRIMTRKIRGEMSRILAWLIYTVPDIHLKSRVILIVQMAPFRVQTAGRSFYFVTLFLRFCAFGGSKTSGAPPGKASI